MGAFHEEEAYVGNLQEDQTMSANYSAHNERLSFGIKYKLSRACKHAAKAHGNTQSLETAWNFSWGEAPAYVPRLKKLNAEATDFTDREIQCAALCLLLPKGCATALRSGPSSRRHRRWRFRV